MIVFIGCVKSKQKHPCPAEEMYTSSLFRYSLMYAKTLTTPDKIFILSAKYGVLRLRDVISPYEECLTNKGSRECFVWAKMCKKQMRLLNIDYCESAVFLCGLKYRRYLMPDFMKAKAPFANKRFGEQLKFYKARLGDAKNR